MGLFETFDMLVRIGVWVKNSWDFFPISPVAIICRLTYFIPKNERTRFGYINSLF